jgi:hypothetical protein
MPACVACSCSRRKRRPTPVREATTDDLDDIRFFIPLQRQMLLPIPTRSMVLLIFLLYGVSVMVSGFSPPLLRRSRANSGSPLAAEKTPTTTSTIAVWNRRAALSTIALVVTATTGSPAISQSMQSSKEDSLETIALGQGVWEPLATKRSSSPDQPVSFEYPPSFCTYAARFLIHYDRGVQAWWTQLATQSVSSSSLDTTLLEAADVFEQPPPFVSYHRLSASFASFSKSLQLTFATVQPSALYDLFVQSYGVQPDATRHIALLFALLPPQHQPVPQLEQYYYSSRSTTNTARSYLAAAPRSEWAEAAAAAAGGAPSAVSNEDWSKMHQDFAQLLPSQFALVPRTTVGGGRSFAIDPPVESNAVAFATDVLLARALTTPFGPLASVPLTREVPEYTLGTYALFGLAGASGCCLTHALVIPLDGTCVRT